MGGRVEVAAALVFRGGRLLIARRPTGKLLEGLWEFPGGKLEPGETCRDCLQRELREELGIEVGVGPRIAIVEHDYPWTTVRIHFHRCFLVSGKPEPLECSEVEWVDAGMFEGREFPPADVPVLNLLRSSDELWRED